ncbi:MAG: O-antigen ligase family protein [Desulfobacteraceae bacterium]|nr:O-antigen ligase family protein [Desulfobacteraceae bacterium]
MRRFFYAVLLFVAFVNNDPSRTITISRSYGIYFPVSSLVFLVGGSVIVLMNLDKLLRMPKVLVIAGPVFATYVLLKIAVETIAGEIYGLSDMFYTAVELINIILSITLAYCYVSSLKQKDIFALQPICYLILAILCLYYLAIVASEVVLPAVKSITGLSIAIDSLEHGVPPRLGYRRLYGPLGTPPSLGFVLIPICGYSLSLFRLKPKLCYLATFVVSTILIVLTGSRTPLLAYMFLLAYCLLVWWKWKGILALTLSVFIVQLVGWNISTLLPLRINLFKSEFYLDPRRASAFLACYKAWLSSLTSFFFGVGYNEIALVTKKCFLGAAGLICRFEVKNTITKYGFLPAGGPHSIFNWSIASTGLVGLLLRCSFIYYFVWRAIRRIGRFFYRPHSELIMSVCISCVHLFTGDTHTSYPMLMACWFVFYIFALNLLSVPSRPGNLASIYNK